MKGGGGGERKEGGQRIKLGKRGDGGDGKVPLHLLQDKGHLSRVLKKVHSYDPEEGLSIRPKRRKID